MPLELISKSSSVRKFRHPVLFIHGAGMTAGCWKLFQDHFSEAGCDTHALSLRGHGSSDADGTVLLRGCSDYLNDVRSAVEQVGEPVVIVAHSWGGYLVQRYLEIYHDCPAAVLMASAPPASSGPSYWSMFKKFPWLVIVAHLTLRPHHVYSTSESMRELLFRQDTSESEIEEHKRALEKISPLLYFQTMLRAPRADAVTTKMLVLGADADRIYTTDMVESTAAAYGTEAQIIPEMCHMMMIDPDWRLAADAILDWLD
ncbi:alpha/beta hydrolase [Oceaniferula spumae]|uniref:Alpha/beta hydrolase n=1 Tax=Oceaniferula spumae TaxID=2979115 RepID=A0AAT9FKC5_9BACT